MLPKARTVVDPLGKYTVSCGFPPPLVCTTTSTDAISPTMFAWGTAGVYPHECD